MKKGNNLWQIFYLVLLVAWLLDVGLYMAGINGGFLTNYLADLTFPPWFYIHIRGLNRNDRHVPNLKIFGDFFGRSPEIAMVSILVVGIVTEIKTLFWPHGPITGVYDPMDIVAYSIGLLICFFFDKFSKRLPW